MLDPLSDAVIGASSVLARTLNIDETAVFRQLMEPSKEEYGDFSFPAMRYTRDINSLLTTVQSELLKELGDDYVEISNVNGFFNFKLNDVRLASRVIKWSKDGNTLSVPPIPQRLTIVVEHTSANPVHPLHIGHTRNACIGDTLARMLKARGHKVITRFYIDDVGRQVAIAALGVKLLGIDVLGESNRRSIKPDALVGWIYAVTSTTIDLLKAKASNDTSEVEKLSSTLVRLKSQDPIGAFDRLYSAILSLKDPEAEISSLNSRYEQGLEPERSLVRNMVNAVLEGFKESLARLHVEFDAWDWESDMVWSGLVSKLVSEAKSSRFYTKYKDADSIDIPAVIGTILASDKEAMSSIKVPKGFTLPPLILLRSDGTSLYTTRDLAYSIYKFSQSNADKVINVIGADQRLPQLQLRLALLGLGYRKEALNMIHYDYEIVRLTSGSMHGRRGEYITLDSLLDELKARVLHELLDKNPNIDRNDANLIAENVAVGALRFFMVHMSATKPLTFSVEKALNLKESSGPYLQYTYVRAFNILEKHGPLDLDAADPSKCTGARRTLLVRALRTPLVAAKAADDLAPEDLVSHLLGLADMFNEWYETDSVIREPDNGARELKALIVELVRQALKLGMDLLGIPTLNRM